jgi:O-antigen/teichoic acid export membrane protein
MSANSWDWQDIGRQVLGLRRSRIFHGTASNSAYSLIEYIAQPALMVISAPFLVGRLGLDRYGIWVLVSSFTGTVGIFQIGLGDAIIKYVSSYKGRNDTAGVSRIISGTLALSALLGALPALVLFLAAPYLVHHVFKINPDNYLEAIRAIQIGGLLLWIQGIFQVFSNTLKAYEEYGPPAKISVLVKSATILGAVCLVFLGRGVVAILLVTAAVTLAGTYLQAAAARRVLQVPSLWPRLDRKAWSAILGFGFYSWIQNAAGVAFSQADRLLIAMMLGTGSLTYYTLCVQVAQQIHGLVAAAFGFLFPHISAKHEAGNKRGVRNAFRLAVLVNVGLSVALTAPLVLLGRRILTLWMGAEFATHSYQVLIILAVGFCALSLNVVPHFTLLGLGKVRFLSFSNLLGGTISLVGAALLIPPFGLIGAAAGRLFYGPAISVNYWKVEKSLSAPKLVRAFD